MSIRAIVAGPNEGTFSHQSKDDQFKSGETFLKGAVVIADTGTGFYKEATGADPSAIIGFADEPAVHSPAKPGFSRYMRAFQGQVFEGTIATGSGFNSAAADYTLAQTDLFKSYGLNKDLTTGLWYVDTNTSTSVVIVGFKPAEAGPNGLNASPVGTVGARVFFIVKTARTLIA